MLYYIIYFILYRLYYILYYILYILYYILSMYLVVLLYQTAVRLLRKFRISRPSFTTYYRVRYVLRTLMTFCRNLKA